MQQSMNFMTIYAQFIPKSVIYW